MGNGNTKNTSFLLSPIFNSHFFVARFRANDDDIRLKDSFYDKTELVSPLNGGTR
jgi:hypothetical protein